MNNLIPEKDPDGFYYWISLRTSQYKKLTKQQLIERLLKVEKDAEVSRLIHQRWITAKEMIHRFRQLFDQ